MGRPRCVVVIGASGSGKTATLKCLEARGHPWLRCFYFDSIGVPTPAIIKRDFGGPEGWQASATGRWIRRLTSDSKDGVVSVLEGQTRPSFVRSAAQEAHADGITLVLLDCSPAVRRSRLMVRGQAYLADRRMEAWARYLRAEASAFSVPIIDTSSLGISAAADALEAAIQLGGS
jgi:hypothetical protein